MLPYAIDNPEPSDYEPVVALIAVNLAWFAAQRLWPEVNGLAFVPAHPSPVTVLTSQFLHAGAAHLAINMYALWLFGPELAKRLGRWFLPFYLASGAAANALHWAAAPASTLRAVGASGAISGVIGAYCLLFPRARLRFYRGRMSRLRRPAYMRTVYTMSALLFAALFLLLQTSGALSHDPLRPGVGYWAHLGGLLFGFAARPFMPSAPPREWDPEDVARRAAQALDEGREDEAAALYAAAAERDPAFCLPSAAAQLRMGGALFRSGRARLARLALEGLAGSRPGDPAAAEAELLLGDLELGRFKELARAAERYARAAAHPGADARLRALAAEGLASARAALDRNLVDAAGETDACAVLFEAAPPLSEAQRAAVAEVLDVEAGPRAGFLVRALPRPAAEAAARALERSGVPAVVLPEGRRVRLSPPVAVDGLSLDARGPAGPDGFAWEELMLAAAAWVPRPLYERAPPGLLEVDVESVQGRDVRDVRPWEERRSRAVRLELVARDGRRARWQARPEDDEAGARGLLGALEARAPGAALDEGARALLEGRCPEAHFFQDEDSLEAYLEWQAQLARLKGERGYGPSV